MCIIISKEAGVKTPTSEIIKNCWINNTDGAGFMYNHNGRVYIKKGFMTLKALNKALSELYSKIDTERTSIIYHFRITTHGGTTPDNTHPFPITSHINSLKKLENVAPIGVAHNGIIPIEPRTKTISDTMEYIAQVLAPVYLHKNDFYKDKNLLELVENTLQSKLAILTGAGEITYIGDFNTYEGLKFSNYNYKPYTYKYSKSYGYYMEAPAEEQEAEILIAEWLDSRECYVAINNAGYKEKYIADGYLIDEAGLVYEYDYQIDKCSIVEGAKVYTTAGELYSMNEEQAEYVEVITEKQLDDFYYKASEY